MSVSPRSALLDVPVKITLSGVRPGSRTTITATAKDSAGTTWSSDATFVADATGAVQLSQVPVEGSYHDRDPMGLFETMTPTGGSTATFYIYPAAQSLVTLTATVAGKVVAVTAVQRLTPEATGVTDTPERPATAGIYGDLFTPPPSAGRHPAVLTFGGSVGGEETTFLAESLAAHGYPTLSLAYYAEPGLPSTLTNIPLEFFVKALRILLARPDVDPEHVLVLGVDRGSEAALLLAAHYPSLIHGVVTGSPSALVFGSFTSIGQPAWTLAGQGIPYASDTDLKRGITEPTDVPASIIPVEKINGPIMTVCGEDDLYWASCPFATAITGGLQANGRTNERIALEYPLAGRSVGGLAAYYSTTTTQNGSVAVNAAAEADAHQQLLALLRRQ